MEEKRRHPRVSIQVGVTCEIEGEEPFEGTVNDLSVGGVFIESAAVPRFGAKITIMGTLPGTQGVLRLPGVVRWRKDSGFGVQFGLLGAKETHAIAQVIHRRR